MDSTYLKENQPIVYKTLQNAFINDKTSHAYIISGTKGLPVFDIAKFMAASFVCENKNEGLACNQCNTCKRINENQYADLTIIKGIDLKADEISKLQDEFSKSAIENNKVRIYIIDLIENAPIASLNKLLKFIEEPENNIKAIFTTNSISSVLQTIVSRCQVINLKEYSNEKLVEYLKENGASLEDANLISKISNDANLNLQIINQDSYKIVKEVIEDSLNYLINHDDFYFVYMENEGLKQIEGNEELYLDILQVCFLQAIIKKENKDDVGFFFDEQIKQLSINYKNLEFAIDVISQTKKAILSNASSKLSFDSLFIKLLKEK